MLFKFFKHNRCGKVSTAGEWNNATLVANNNRQTKRTFKKIQESIGQARWYICPTCGKKALMSEITPLMKSEVQE